MITIRYAVTFGLQIVRVKTNLLFKVVSTELSQFMSDWVEQPSIDCTESKTLCSCSPHLFPTSIHAVFRVEDLFHDSSLNE